MSKNQKTQSMEVTPEIEPLIQRLKDAFMPSAILGWSILITFFANSSLALLMSILFGKYIFLPCLIVCNSVGFGCLLGMKLMVVLLTPYMSAIMMILLGTPFAALLGASFGYTSIVSQDKSFFQIYAIAVLVCYPVGFAIHALTRLFEAKLNVRKTENQKLQAEQEVTKQQLLVLQNQIEPHFIFNILANIRAMMHQDVQSADRLLTNFTEYLRVGMGVSGKYHWPLSDEIQAVKQYLAIQEQRFPDINISWVNHLPEHTLDSSHLPPLSLQPLVENAYRHALVPKGNRGNISIYIDLKQIEGTKDLGIIVSVKDDGIGLFGDVSTKGNGLAIRNIKQRLSHLYNSEAQFELFENGHEEGCTAQMVFPASRSDFDGKEDKPSI